MAIHVLQTFTGQGSAASSSAEEEAAGHLVSGSPHGVTGALETEHRVEDVQRNHRLAVSGVGGTSCDELGHGTGLVDALVHDLAVDCLTVGQHEVMVDRGVVLAVAVVNLQRREPGVHTEGTCLIRDDRNEALAQFLIPHEFLEGTNHSHGRSNLLLAGILTHDLQIVHARDGQRLVGRAALGYPAAEILTALEHVLDLLGILTGVVVRR